MRVRRERWYGTKPRAHGRRNERTARSRRRPAPGPRPKPAAHSKRLQSHGLLTPPKDGKTPRGAKTTNRGHPRTHHRPDARNPRTPGQPHQHSQNQRRNRNRQRQNQTEHKNQPNNPHQRDQPTRPATRPATRRSRQQNQEKPTAAHPRGDGPRPTEPPRPGTSPPKAHGGRGGAGGRGPANGSADWGLLVVLLAAGEARPSMRIRTGTPRGGSTPADPCRRLPATNGSRTHTRQRRGGTNRTTQLPCRAALPPHAPALFPSEARSSLTRFFYTLLTTSLFTPLHLLTNTLLHGHLTPFFWHSNRFFSALTYSGSRQTC